MCSWYLNSASFFFEIKMKFVYKNSRIMSEEEMGSNASSFQSSENSDEVFGSPCSNYSDCEFCEERRRNESVKKKSSNQGSPAQTSYHTALERTSDSTHTSSGRYRNNVYNVPYYGAVDTMPLLTTAVGDQRMKGFDSSSDSLGSADLSSSAVLLTLDKLHSQKKQPQRNKQSSLVTIFSVWNTTLGSSLLAMAWGVDRAGLGVALTLLVLMAALCLYTAYLLLAVNLHHGGETCEVPALCRIFLGRWAERVAHLFSLLVLIGANIVYWILISNFLFFTVNYFVDLNTSSSTEAQNTTIFCPNGVDPNSSIIPVVLDGDGPPYWRLHSSVPLYVTLIVFPLLNFKSATFFTKFNSLGTLSVLYLMVFVSVKLSSWGINTSSLLESPRKWQDAAALSGMLALSFYIHNIIITIMNSNRRQDRNGRDLTIAFVLVMLTYMLVGAGFYICFPLLKTCIADNILNNFEMHDVMTVVARILLLFQVITVYPLVAFMLREEAILLLPIRKSWKEIKLTTICINAVIVSICILFACFCPNIGTIIRYTGAVSGLVHIFTLPPLLYVRSLKIRGQLTRTKCAMFSVIIALGVVNFAMQFFISE